jgi:hypothetical protein
MQELTKWIMGLHNPTGPDPGTAGDLSWTATALSYKGRKIAQVVKEDDCLYIEAAKLPPAEEHLRKKLKATSIIAPCSVMAADLSTDDPKQSLPRLFTETVEKAAAVIQKCRNTNKTAWQDWHEVKRRRGELKERFPGLDWTAADKTFETVAAAQDKKIKLLTFSAAAYGWSRHKE